ncbi:hypothetical protein BDZ89DRAFT_193640 [Hymenopellis radicata]|nr:hypothetical protein BDZ89DRAFT_193640 [Hymenopellis radicata]
MDQTELYNASTNVSSPPINALPQELFSHILYCCCEETSPGQDQYDLLSSITAVCRHWRDVAIASSELWTKIAFGQDSYIPHTPRFLERSASRLIDVHPHLARLRMLKLTIRDAPKFGRRIGSENYTSILEALSSTLLPHLTHLLVHSQVFIPSNSAHASIEAPSLRWLNVRHLPTTSITAHPQLTTLIIHEVWPTWQGLHDVILTCSSLETLVLPSFDRSWPAQEDYDPNDATSRISAPSLRSLAVAITECRDCMLFLLDMPNLEYLEVSGNGSISQHFTSLPKLTTLRLNDTLVADEESFFRSLSQLRRLELINVYPDAQVVTSHPRGTKFPFPRLSSLVYVSKKETNVGTRDWLLSVARLGAAPFTIELGGAAVQVLDFTEEYEMDALRKRNISIINTSIPSGLLDDEKHYADYEHNDFEDYDLWPVEDEYDDFFNG